MIFSLYFSPTVKCILKFLLVCLLDVSIAMIVLVPMEFYQSKYYLSYILYPCCFKDPPSFQSLKCHLNHFVFPALFQGMKFTCMSLLQHALSPSYILPYILVNLIFLSLGNFQFQYGKKTRILVTFVFPIVWIDLFSSKPGCLQSCSVELNGLRCSLKMWRTIQNHSKLLRLLTMD